MLLAFLVGVAGWAYLLLQPLPLGLFPTTWALFVALALLVKGFGSRVVPRETHSLVGIVDLAAILYLGPLQGAWVAASGALLYQVARGVAEVSQARQGRRNQQPLLLVAGSGLFNGLFDSGLKTAMALATGAVYALLGGHFPPLPLQIGVAGPALGMFLAWFILDHAGWGSAELILGGWSGLREWFGEVIVPSLLVELLPLPLSLLLVDAYGKGMGLPFILLSASLTGTSFVIQRLVATTLEQRHSVRELATLNEVARAIVQAEMSVEGLAELIYEQASRVVDTSTFHLGLFEGDSFTLKLRYSDGVRQDPLTVNLPAGEGIVGWMRQSKQPLLVRDFEKEMEQLPARPRYLSNNPPRSGVFVPLISRGEVIGSLSIQSGAPGSFTGQHLRILSFIANQAAVAIEKARLYEAARERAQELERVAAENATLYTQVREERDRLGILYDVSRDLTRRVEIDDMLHRLLERTVASIGAEEGTVLLVGTKREPPRVITSHTGKRGDLQAILERGLAGWVAEHQEEAFISDARHDPRWLPTGRDVGSAMAVPILHDNKTWGVLTLTHSRANAFHQNDTILLRAMAEQAAVALEARRLYEAQRRRAVQLQTISQIMRSILSILDLDRLLAEVVDLVRQRFGYAHVHVFTLDQSGRQVIFRASTDPNTPFWTSRGGQASIEEGLVGWVARNAKPVIVGDVRQDPRWLPDQVDVASEVAVPLKVAGQVVGVLDVQSEEVDAFDQEDLFILHTMADQIAMALESARLYATQQEEAWVLNAMLQVAENIAQAPNLDDLLEVIVRLVPLLVGVEHCILFLRDRGDGDFQALHGYGVPHAALAWLHFHRGEMPAFDQAAIEANPVALVGAEEKGTVASELWDSMGQGSVWLFPLLAGGQVSGVLALGLDEVNQELTARQHTILAGITNQAGIALEEARLRRASAERQRMEQELQVAREIQRSLLPASPPAAPGWSIEVAWQSAREVGGDFYDFIHLPENQLGVVIADVSDKGVPAAMFMALSRSLVRASAVGQHSPAEALQRANHLLYADAQAEAFVTVFYCILDLATGRVRYASAGHNPPLLCRGIRGGLSDLEAKGIILGVLQDIQLEEKVVQLEAGDTLVLYTDGVTEAINSAEEQFGEERLGQIVCAHHDDSLGQVRQALLDALQEHGEGRPPFDDVTLVLVRRISD